MPHMCKEKIPQGAKLLFVHIIEPVFGEASHETFRPHRKNMYMHMTAKAWKNVLSTNKCSIKIYDIILIFAWFMAPPLPLMHNIVIHNHFSFCWD